MILFVSVLGQEEGYTVKYTPPPEGRDKVKRDLIQYLRTYVFGNFRISEHPGSLDFTLSRNFLEFHVKRENVFSKIIKYERGDSLKML